MTLKIPWLLLKRYLQATPMRYVEILFWCKKWRNLHKKRIGTKEVGGDWVEAMLNRIDQYHRDAALFLLQNQKQRKNARGLWCL